MKMVKNKSKVRRVAKETKKEVNSLTISKENKSRAHSITQMMAMKKKLYKTNLRKISRELVRKTREKRRIRVMLTFLVQPKMISLQHLMMEQKVMSTQEKRRTKKIGKRKGKLKKMSRKRSRKLKISKRSNRRKSKQLSIHWLSSTAEVSKQYQTLSNYRMRSPTRVLQLWPKRLQRLQRLASKQSPIFIQRNLRRRREKRRSKGRRR